MFEVEQKFRVQDLELLRGAILAQFRNVQSTSSYQEDLYLAHPCRDFASSDEAFRLRTVDERTFLTYKGPRQYDTRHHQTTKTRREIEIELNLTAEQRPHLQSMFEILGFQPSLRVVKHRQNLTTVWRGWTTTFALDEVQDLGRFVEIEIVADGPSLSDAQQAVRELAGRLDLDDSIQESYLELLLQDKD